MEDIANSLSNINNVSLIHEKIAKFNKEAEKIIDGLLTKYKDIFKDEANKEKEKIGYNESEEVIAKDISTTITKAKEIIKTRLSTFKNKYENLNLFTQDNISKKITEFIPELPTFSDLNDFIISSVNNIKDDLNKYIVNNNVKTDTNSQRYNLLTLTEINTLKTTIENNKTSLTDLTNLDTLNNDIHLAFTKGEAKHKIDNTSNLNQSLKTHFKSLVDKYTFDNINNLKNFNLDSNPVKKAEVLGQKYGELNIYLTGDKFENIKSKDLYKFADLDKQLAFDAAYDKAKELNRTKKITEISNGNFTERLITEPSIIDNTKTELESAYTNLKRSSDEYIKNTIDKKIDGLNNFNDKTKAELKKIAKEADSRTSANDIIEKATQLNTSITNATNNLNAFTNNNDKDIKDKLLPLINDLVETARNDITTAKNGNTGNNPLYSSESTITNKITDIDGIKSKFSNDKLELAKKIAKSNLVDNEKQELLSNLINNPQNKPLDDLKREIEASLQTKEAEILQAKKQEVINKINSLKALSSSQNPKGEKEIYEEQVNASKTLENIDNVLENALNKAKTNIEKIIRSDVEINRHQELYSNLNNARNSDQPVINLNDVYDIVILHSTNYDSSIDALHNLSEVQKNHFKQEIGKQTLKAEKDKINTNAMSLNTAYGNLSTLLNSGDIANIKNTDKYKLADDNKKSEFDSKLTAANNALMDINKTITKTATEIDAIKTALESAKTALTTSSTANISKIESDINNLNNLDASSRRQIINKAKSANDKSAADTIVRDATALNTSLGTLQTSITNAQDALNKFKEHNNNLLPLIQDLVTNAQTTIDTANTTKTQKANNNSGNSLGLDKEEINRQKTNVETISTKFSNDKLELAKKIANSNLTNDDKEQLLSDLINNPHNKNLDVLKREIQNTLQSKEARILQSKQQEANNKIDQLSALSTEEKNTYKGNVNRANSLADVDTALNNALDQAKLNIHSLITSSPLENKDELKQNANTARNNDMPVTALNNVYDSVTTAIDNYYDGEIDKLTSLSATQNQHFKAEIKKKTLNSDKATELSKAQTLNRAYKALDDEINKIPSNITTNDEYTYADADKKTAFDQAFKAAKDLNKDKNNYTSTDVENIKHALTTAYEALKTSSTANKQLIDTTTFTNFSNEKTTAIKDHAKTLNSSTDIQNYLNKAKELDSEISKAKLAYDTALGNYNSFNNNDVLKKELSTKLDSAKSILDAANAALTSAKTDASKINLTDFTTDKEELASQTGIINDSKISEKFKSDKVDTAVDLIKYLPKKTYPIEQNGEKQQEELRSKFLDELLEPGNITIEKYEEIKNKAVVAYKKDILDELSNSIYLGNDLDKQKQLISTSDDLSGLNIINNSVEDKLVKSLKQKIDLSPLKQNNESDSDQTSSFATKDDLIKQVDDLNKNKNTSDTGIIHNLNNIFKKLFNDSKSKADVELKSNESKLNPDVYNELNQTLMNATTIEQINEVLSSLESKLTAKDALVKSITENNNLDDNQKQLLIDEVNTASDDNLDTIKGKLDNIKTINRLNNLSDSEKKTYEDRIISDKSNMGSTIIDEAELQNDKNKAIHDIDQLGNITPEQKKLFKENVNRATDKNSNTSGNTPNKEYEKAKALDDAYKALKVEINKIPSEITTNDEYTYADADKKTAFDNALKAAQDLNNDKNKNDVNEVESITQALTDAYRELKSSSAANKKLIDDTIFTNFSDEKTTAIKDHAKTLDNKKAIQDYFAKAKSLDDAITSLNSKFENANRAFEQFNTDKFKKPLNSELTSAKTVLDNVLTAINNAKNSGNNVSDTNLDTEIANLSTATTNLDNSKINDKFNANKLELANTLANNLPEKSYPVEKDGETEQEELRSKYLKELINATPSGNYSSIESSALAANKKNIENELTKSTYLGNELAEKIQNIKDSNSLSDLTSKNNEIENNLITALRKEISDSKLSADDKASLNNTINELNDNKAASETGIINGLNDVFNNLIKKAKQIVKGQIDAKKDKLGDNDYNSLVSGLNNANSIKDINDVASSIETNLDAKEKVIEKINANTNLDNDQKNSLIDQVDKIATDKLDIIENKLDKIDEINNIENLTDDQKTTFENDVISASNDNAENANNVVDNNAKLQSQKNKAINDINKLKNISKAQKDQFIDNVNNSMALNESNSENAPKKYYEKAKALDDAYKTLNDSITALPNDFKNSQDYKLATPETQKAFDDALEAANNALNNDQKTVDKTASDITAINTALANAKEALTNSSVGNKDKIRTAVNELDQLDQNSKNNIENAALISDTAGANAILESAKALNDDIKKLNNEITTANNNITKFEQQGNEKLLALINDKLTDSRTKITNAENAKEQATTNIPANSIATHNETVNSNEATLKELNNKFNIKKLAEANKIANSNLSDEDKKILLNELINSLDSENIDTVISNVHDKLINKQKEYAKAEIDKIDALSTEEKNN
ncbi:UNVERIFIED_CONTAM: hypothetical protein O8I53_13705 [Campylobacter lari]